MMRRLLMAAALLAVAFTGLPSVAPVQDAEAAAQKLVPEMKYVCGSATAEVVWGEPQRVGDCYFMPYFVYWLPELRNFEYIVEVMGMRSFEKPVGFGIGNTYVGTDLYSWGYGSLTAIGFSGKGYHLADWSCQPLDDFTFSGYGDRFVASYGSNALSPTADKGYIELPLEERGRYAVRADSSFCPGNEHGYVDLTLPSNALSLDGRFGSNTFSFQNPPTEVSLELTNEDTYSHYLLRHNGDDLEGSVVMPGIGSFTVDAAPRRAEVTVYRQGYDQDCTQAHKKINSVIISLGDAPSGGSTFSLDASFSGFDISATLTKVMNFRADLDIAHKDYDVEADFAGRSGTANVAFSGTTYTPDWLWVGGCEEVEIDLGVQGNGLDAAHVQYVKGQDPPLMVESRQSPSGGSLLVDVSALHGIVGGVQHFDRPANYPMYLLWESSTDYSWVNQGDCEAFSVGGVAGEACAIQDPWWW